MHHIDVLLTSEPAGGTAPFRHDSLSVTFHVFGRHVDLPLITGSLWAFVDWAAPDMAGLEICRRLRCDPLSAKAHITMILDAMDEDQRRRATRAAADDYLVGPVTRSMLLDRIMAARLPEHGLAGERLIVLGDLTMDVAAFRVAWNGKPVPLMPNEFRLLRYLAEHHGRVFTRSQLIAALGKQETEIDERTVDVWVGRLRRALRDAGAGTVLRTVRSLGYVFDTPAPSSALPPAR